VPALPNFDALREWISKLEDRVREMDSELTRLTDVEQRQSSEISELEKALSEVTADRDAYDSLVTSLEDVVRGVRTLPEVMDGLREIVR
jgi:chromosome segregation ATPase